MGVWREDIDRIIEFNDRKVLTGGGSVSNAQMESHVDSLYNKFDTRRKLKDTEEADQEDLKELEVLEKQISKRE